MKKHCLVVLLLIVVIFPLMAAKTLWSECQAPKVSSVDVNSSDQRKITVNIEGATGDAGSDKLLVELLENGKTVQSKTLGKSKKTARNTTFTLSHSGKYSVRVTGIRNSESQTHVSELYSFDYVLPLDSPQVSAQNSGNGILTVSWNAVDEAESYKVYIYDFVSDELVLLTETTECSCALNSLKENTAYNISVASVRGSQTSLSSKIKKTFKNEKDRLWQFAWFGQSTKETLNHFEMIDSDDLTFKLYAGSRTEQGGKFTTYHDGISYYYTEIDALNENFELTATITVDWINPTPDGQEGFGIIIMDSLGENGVSSVNHYTNSVSLIATKFEERIDGVKYSGKDVLGARFVTGITDEVLALGDDGIALNGSSVSHAYSYYSGHLVQSGKSYTITVKKDNSGYHCIYSIPEEEKEWDYDEDGNLISKVYPEEFTLYGVDKLLQLDKEHVYVGFAAARWCECTVSNVKLTITDPLTDAPAEEEPSELVSLQTKINSPTAYSSKSYPFVFSSNCPGTIEVRKSGTKYYYIENARVEANEDFCQTIELLDDSNDLYVLFTPDSSYRPGENQVIAQYDENRGFYVESYNSVGFYHSVSVRSFEGSTIYVSPSGFAFNEGTKESPVDIYTAIKYVKAGQTIELSGGTYNLSKQIVIERGNDGTEENPIVLTSAEGEKAVLKFARTASSGGLVLWGDYWILDNFEITNTPDTVKGLQIAGDYNIIQNITAYKCGDTGIQISGSSAETWEKWPHDNIVRYCISHDNCDLAQNNADGFAAKLTCAENNVFDTCIAYCNIDDGWDLYSKIESGPIGKVVIRNCVAYGNGSLSDNSGSGDGNGFKLGGDGIAVDHLIENCISFGNNMNGITSNSNPALQVKNCILYGNGECNLTLYGKGSSERQFVCSGVVSVEGGLSDNIKEMPSLASEDNYFCNGTDAVNSLGQRITSKDFVSTDIKNASITIENGQINTHGFLNLL